MKVEARENEPGLRSSLIARESLLFKAGVPMCQKQQKTAKKGQLETREHTTRAAAPIPRTHLSTTLLSMLPSTKASAREMATNDASG